MSQENVEVVRRLWDRWEADDLDGMLETLSDEVVTHWRGGAEDRTYHGKEGYLELAASWGEEFADWKATAEEFIEAGDRVLVRNHQSGRGEVSGVAVEMEAWFVYEVGHGKIVRQTYYRNRDEALDAVGLSE